MTERVSSPGAPAVVRALQIDLKMRRRELRVEAVTVCAAKAVEKPDQGWPVFERPAARIGKEIQRERKMQPERRAQAVQAPGRSITPRGRRRARGEKIA